MLDYYKRFWRMWWKDFASSTREQVIGALLVIGILACQLKFGIIRTGEIGANLLSIAWPYAALVGAFFLWHLIRSPYKLDEEKQKTERVLNSKLNDVTKRLERKLSILPEVHEQPLGIGRTTYFIDIFNESEASTIFGVMVTVSDMSPELVNWSIPLHLKHDNPGKEREFVLNPRGKQEIDLVTGSGRAEFKIVDVIGEEDGGRNWTRIEWKDVPTGVFTLTVKVTGNDTVSDERQFYVWVGEFPFKLMCSSSKPQLAPYIPGVQNAGA